MVYMLLHLRVFKACTLCVGLNIAVPEQDLTVLKGAALLASHIICQAYKGTLLLQYLYRYVLLLIIRGVMLKREEKNVCRYIYAPYTHTWKKKPYGSVLFAIEEKTKQTVSVLLSISSLLHAKSPVLLLPDSSLRSTSYSHHFVNYYNPLLSCYSLYNFLVCHHTRL